MINAGKYRHRIEIYTPRIVTSENGYQTVEPDVKVLTTYASIKTTKGMTFIINQTDFEQAFTNFTIRYPLTEINRDMLILFKGKVYVIEYLNDIDEANVELEIQAREVVH